MYVRCNEEFLGGNCPMDKATCPIHSDLLNEAIMEKKVCNCEHIDHEMDSHGFFPKNDNHSGSYRADYVGDVCDDCAETHMRNYLIASKHVC